MIKTVAYSVTTVLPRVERDGTRRVADRGHRAI